MKKHVGKILVIILCVGLLTALFRVGPYMQKIDFSSELQYKLGEGQTGYVHISFDDVEICFRNLTANKYESLFDEPFFEWLYSLHEEYGAKVSLYAYADRLKDVPSCYADEFCEASDWLKIGLHAPNATTQYTTHTYAQAKEAWNEFVIEIERITGTKNSVDRVPRLHYFAGNQRALEGMADADTGAKGFLASDDSRVSYHFTEEASDYVYDHDGIVDLDNGLVFLGTDLRGEWFSPSFSSMNTYKTPIHTSVYDELTYRYSSELFADDMTSCVFFTHEWQLYKNQSLNENVVWIEDVCRYVCDNEKIVFDYPQNILF